MYADLLRGPTFWPYIAILVARYVELNLPLIVAHQKSHFFRRKFDIWKYGSYLCLRGKINKMVI